MAKAFKRAEDIHFAEVGDEFYVTREDRDVVAALNGAAFALVENLDGFTSTTHFSKQFAQQSKLSAQRVRTAVNKAVQMLSRLELIQEVAAGGGGRERPLNFDSPHALEAFPEILNSWQGQELAGGMFVNSKEGDIKVIVPNVTDGPIKTCPPHTCTIPAGLFTSHTIVRTFNQDWARGFKAFRRSGLVHFRG